MIENVSLAMNLTSTMKKQHHAKLVQKPMFMMPVQESVFAQHTLPMSKMEDADLAMLLTTGMLSLTNV